MSKRYSIKWSENDEKELKRLVKNFNAKVTRLNKKDDELRGYLPQKVSYAQMRDTIQTRNDLDIAKRKLESFTKKGSEKLTTTAKGLTMTKWEKKQGRLTKQRFNKKLWKSATNDNIDYLPTQLESDYAENVSSLEEYRKLMQSVEKFHEKGSTNLIAGKDNFKITKWEWEHYKVQEAINNEHKAKELEHLKNQKLKSRGQEISELNTHERNIAEMNLQPTDRKIENINKKRWEVAKRTIDHVLDADYLNNKKEMYRDNYFMAIDMNGLTDELKDIIKELPIQEFIDTYYLDTEADIDFLYSLEDIKTKNETLTALWVEVLKTNYIRKLSKLGISHQTMVNITDNIGDEEFWEKYKANKNVTNVKSLEKIWGVPKRK